MPLPRTPLLTVDILIIHQNRLVLICRRNPPFQGCFAIPGGFVEVGERVEEAAVREAGEETGLEVKLLKLIGVYSDPDRDPRGHVVSIVFLGLGTGTLKAGSDAKDISLFSIDEIPGLSFDHNKIIEDARSAIYGILSSM